MKMSGKSKKEIGAGTLLGPLPLVVLSVYDTVNERYNAMTIAWTGIVNTKPPLLSFSVRANRHSHQFLAVGKSVTLNLPDVSLAKATDYLGVKSGKTEDKLAKLALQHQELGAGLAYLPDFPLNLLCEIKSCTPLGSHDLFIAEITNVLADEELVDNKGALHMEQANLLCYLHGQYYALADWQGFFGFSIADPKVYNERKKKYLAFNKR